MASTMKYKHPVSTLKVAGNVSSVSLYINAKAGLKAMGRRVCRIPRTEKAFPISFDFISFDMFDLAVVVMVLWSIKRA